MGTNRAFENYCSKEYTKNDPDSIVNCIIGKEVELKRYETVLVIADLNTSELKNHVDNFSIGVFIDSDNDQFTYKNLTPLEQNLLGGQS